MLENNQMLANVETDLVQVGTRNDWIALPEREHLLSSSCSPEIAQQWHERTACWRHLSQQVVYDKHVYTGRITGSDTKLCYVSFIS